MDISAANASILNTTYKQTEVKTNFTQKISKQEASEIKDQIQQNANAIALNSTAIQSSLSSEDKFAKAYDEFQAFLKDIGYEGQSLAELSKDEAAKLVSEDGFFGVDKTSQRIADFIINGANGDEGMLRAGREGMLQGFKDAESIWGGTLPEISQNTIAKAIELVDNAMVDAGFSILDKEA